jgi:hypothetical protein
MNTRVIQSLQEILIFRTKNKIKIAIIPCIPKCECLDHYFSEAHIRNSIIAKPVVWILQ